MLGFAGSLACAGDGGGGRSWRRGRGLADSFEQALKLAEHAGLGYSYQLTPDTWRFHNKSGETASVRPSGPLRVNNGEAMLPTLIAGLGIGVLPQFIVQDALARKTLEIVLPDWSLPPSAVYWLTPPGGHRPKRVEALADFFATRLARKPGSRA